MDQNDPTVAVESSHDLDEESNVTASATEPSPTGDVVAAHDDIPNNGHDIAGAGQNSSDITIQECADSIKDLNARLRASYQDHKDAREDAKYVQLESPLMVATTRSLLALLQLGRGRVPLLPQVS